MAVQTTYHLGGFDPARPNGNAAEVWDGDAGTYTAYAADGSVAGSRPLTIEETARLAAQEAADVEAQAVAAAAAGVQAMYDQAGALHAQLAADVAAVQAAGWDALTPAQRSGIVLRILGGFGQAMTTIQDHATATGTITPS